MSKLVITLLVTLLYAHLIIELRSLSSISDTMHLHWEQSHNTAGDCNIRSLSWMGRVPDEIPQVKNNFISIYFFRTLPFSVCLTDKPCKDV